MPACPLSRWLMLKPGFAVLIKVCAASLATEERLSPFDGKKRDKEKAEVMVCSLKKKGQVAAIRAYPGLSVQGDCSRRDTSDEEKHE